ncbi:hypothetical protein FB566_2531 [Stackebrandtia endophytica]|uniref:Uncharacterized protein n=1 Tax=Stackebrandtia endophytica TaxID=1496996 RepID=A0A543AWN2_9ACTN|nr:hypothetical protein FB566_2531 [Stackebrandtia endophytica]
MQVLPGGRQVTVGFEADRIRLHPPSFGWDDLWEIPLYLVSFLGMIGLFVGGLSLIAAGQPVLGAVLLVLGAVVGIPILFQLLLEAAGYLILPVIIVGALVMVWFPAGRRKMKRMWNSGKAIGEQLTEIKYSDIAAFSPTVNGRRVEIVIQRWSGPSVGLAANGRVGRRLHRALAELHHGHVNAAGG